MSPARWLRAAGHYGRNAARPGRDGPVVLDAEGVLAGLDPVATRADYDVIATVVVFLRGGHGSAELRLAWIRYAYRAAEDLVGTDHPLWLHVARLYRQLLTAQGLTFDAVQVCERFLAVQRRRSDLDATVVSLCTLVNTLHDDGQCERAEDEANVALLIAASGLLTTTTGEIALLSAAAVLAGCGRIQRVQTLLHEQAAARAGLSETGRHQAAVMLARTVQAHPAHCARPGPPISRRAQHPEFWQLQLDLAAGQHTRRQPTNPAATAKARRPR